MASNIYNDTIISNARRRCSTVNKVNQICYMRFIRIGWTYCENLRWVPWQTRHPCQSGMMFMVEISNWMLEPGQQNLSRERKDCEIAHVHSGQLLLMSRSQKLRFCSWLCRWLSVEGYHLSSQYHTAVNHQAYITITALNHKLLRDLS